MRRAALLALMLLAGGAAGGAGAAEGPALPAQQWSFDGPFGVYDRAELQRGFQVDFGPVRNSAERGIEFAGGREHRVTQFLGCEAARFEEQVVSNQ